MYYQSILVLSLVSVLLGRRREGVSGGRQADRKGVREANDQTDIEVSRHTGRQANIHSHTYSQRTHTYTYRKTGRQPLRQT